jgi:hypothetical protein
LVDGKRDLDAVDLHRRQGCRVAEGAVGPAFVVEAEEGFQVRVGVDLGAVALQVHFVILHRPPEALDEDVVVPEELHPLGQLKRNSPSRSRIHSIRGGGGVWNWSTASGDGDGGESIT